MSKWGYEALNPKHNHATAVQRLFEEKSARWRDKYGVHGILQVRLNWFHQMLERQGVSGGRVLDFGCGTGDLAAYLAALGFEVTGADVARGMLRLAETSHASVAVRWIEVAPTTDLPFDDGEFDVVVASSVFEYLAEIDGTLREIRRILAASGLLALTVPDLARPVRKFESVVRCLLRPPLTNALEPVPRVGSYARYLTLSRNRFSLTEWRARLNAAGFDLIAAEAGKHKNPLLLLIGRRTPISPSNF